MTRTNATWARMQERAVARSIAHDNMHTVSFPNLSRYGQPQPPTRKEEEPRQASPADDGTRVAWLLYSGKNALTTLRGIYTRGCSEALEACNDYAKAHLDEFAAVVVVTDKCPKAKRENIIYRYDPDTRRTYAE